MRGTFIVLEGGEGSGKSTARTYLEKAFPDALFTREPGGTPFAEKIRTLFISNESARLGTDAELALVFAGRLHHVREKIAPALQKGRMVISERFDASTFAYQIFGNGALELIPLFYEFRKILGENVPDLYIYLDVEPEAGLKRATQLSKQTDRFESQSLAFHKKVREGYRAFLKGVPHVVIDANRPIEEVQGKILEMVRKHTRAVACAV